MDEIVLCYSGRSRITAEKIAEASGGRIRLNRGPTGDVNFGRAEANTELNGSGAVNKREARELFRDNDVPMPRLLTEDEAFATVVDGTYIIGRPDHHMKGRGFWKCHTMYEVSRAIQGTRRKQAATHWMEFIPNAQEYRVHIWLGKSIRISEKDFTDMRVTRLYEGRRGDIRAELSFMARKPTCDKETLKSVRRAAKKAVKALDLDFGAVDVLVNDNGVYVLEVNSAPGLGGSLPTLYSQKMLEWADERE
jgi:glutathione synthase/RimK-type ligase-like ATP-grasp enzyme